MKKVIFSILCLLCVSVASAHQPRITWDNEDSKEHPIIVSQPEISQAFYWELRWNEAVYKIISDTWFLLYTNILVSDTTWTRTDFMVHILEWNNDILTKLDGTKMLWSWFYEKFAGDSYLKWPEREREVVSWMYTIVVSNTDNEGKYVLAIGKKESFDFKEIIHTYKTLPALKTYFFGKPAWEMFNNYIGIMTWWILLIVVGTSLIAIALIKRIKKRK